MARKTKTPRNGIHFDIDTALNLLRDANELTDNAVMNGNSHMTNLKKEMVDLASMSALGRQYIDMTTLLLKAANQKAMLSKQIMETSAVEGGEVEDDVVITEALLAEMDKFKDKYKNK